MKRKTFALYWSPVIAYMALIFILSSFPLQLKGDTLKDQDKTIHFFEYGFLAYLSYRALRKGNSGKPELKWIIWAWLISVLFGITDEIHQYFVPERFMEMKDILANALGSAIALLPFLYQNRKKC